VKEDGGNRVYSSQDIEKKSVRIAVAERQDVRSLKDQIDRMNRRAHRNFTEAIFGFAKTIELKDYYTGKHVESTVQYATEIAKGLRLTGYEVEMIRQASMLHDLGKIGISEKILLKKGKLSPREFEEIKKHPRIAVDILRPIHFFHSLIPLILYHHERWDGKGYPEGLKGEEIPMGARVVALADVYQALTSDRPYHRAFSREQAIDIIKEDSGKRFDPSIVEVFMRILTQG
jgi:HD-GYP domain-containing protein (c-di-GMP phosphodiesterase class II)